MLQTGFKRGANQIYARGEYADIDGNCRRRHRHCFRRRRKRARLLRSKTFIYAVV